MKISKHVTISGKVQGVFFRATTRQMAEQLGVRGWVRNTADGKVEAIFEGDEQKVNELVRWCNKGPDLAQVEDVTVEEKDTSDDFTGFSIKY